VGQRGGGSTLLVHGDSDPVLRVEADKATVNAIAGAELLVIFGMGHDLAKGLWPQVAEAIVRHARGCDLR